MSDAVTHHKMDVHADHRMAAADVFGPWDRVELIKGELVAMAPIGQDHAGTVNRLNYALVVAPWQSRHRLRSEPPTLR